MLIYGIACAPEDLLGGSNGGGGVHHFCWYYWRNTNRCNLYPYLYHQM